MCILVGLESKISTVSDVTGRGRVELNFTVLIKMRYVVLLMSLLRVIHYVERATQVRLSLVRGWEVSRQRLL